MLGNRYLNLIVQLPLISLLALLTACPAGNPADQAHEQTSTLSELNLDTALVEQRESSGYVELTGTVASRSSVPLSTKLMSEITQLSVEEGQQVAKGQVLVVLDDSDILAMRSEAAAYRAEAQAALAEVDAVHNQALAGVDQAQAGLAQARATLVDAQRDYERMSVLFEKQVISRSELDKVQLGVDIATEGVSQAEGAVSQAQAAVAQATSRTPQVEARQRQADAKDMQAAALQDYAVLQAPFDGVVSARYFDQGQLSVPGQPILVLEPLTALRVRVSLPEAIASSLQIGDELEVLPDSAVVEQALHGTIVVLGAIADPASRTVLAEIELADSQGLRSGQFVRVRVPGAARSILSVPLSAVVQDRDLLFAWRVSAGGILTQAPVDTGNDDGSYIEIVRGLSAGDRIVVNPQPGMYAGANIGAAAQQVGE